MALRWTKEDFDKYLTRQKSWADNSSSQLPSAPKEQKPLKYGNKKTEVDGIVFDSRKEARHYQLLKARMEAGEISDLMLQVPFRLTVPGQKTIRYVCDFVYLEAGRVVYVDVKGYRTREYEAKKRLLQALHGVVLTEV